MKYLSEKTKLAVDYFYLNSNRITDFSTISGFSNVQELHLEGNPFSDLSFIANMSNLRLLYANSSGVSDISVFRDFKGLNSSMFRPGVYLESCLSLVDCSALKNLTSLFSIRLKNSSNLSSANVEEIADWYNSRSDKNIDEEYEDYLQGSSKRVFISKNLNDNSEQIKNMMNMSVEDKLKIKKIKK